MNITLRRLEKRFDLQTYIEQYEFKMVGENAVMHCPQCEKDDKLYVLMKEKQDRNGETVPRGTWICYYCNDTDGGGAGRTCLSLIEWLEDVEFIEAAKRLAEGGSSQDADFIGAMEKALAAFDDDEDKDEAPPPTVHLPREFIRIDERKYPPYLAERGISVERAMRFRLGYCKSGYYENRLIAPVYFERKLVGFQARYMKKKPPMCTHKDGELPCFYCGGEDEHVRLKKTKHAKGAKMSHVLYNWDEARSVRRLVLVESPWAVIKIGRCGAGTFGKNMSSAQLELVMKSDAEEVVIMWDRDEDHAPGKGGYDKSVKIAEQLSQFVRVRAVRMPDARDPDEHTMRSIKKLIAKTKVLDANAAWAEKVARRMSWLED